MIFLRSHSLDAQRQSVAATLFSYVPYKLRALRVRAMLFLARKHYICLAYIREREMILSLDGDATAAFEERFCGCIYRVVAATILILSAACASSSMRVSTSSICPR